MFSAVGKVFQYLLGEEDKSEQETPRSPPQPVKEEEDFPITKQLDGKISHVFSSHGLIDNEVYFSFDDVIGGYRPCIGDSVGVVAVQEYSGGGWHAKQVTLALSWGDSEDDDDDENRNDSDDENKLPAEVVGKVTSFRDKRGYVNDSIYLDLSACVHGDYFPATGDWVKVVVTYGDDDKTDIRAKSIEPLRVTETEGVITAFQGDHGYIDSEVFFTPEACHDGFIPRKWEPVSYKAVESAQGRCTWRAISIRPSVKPDTTRLVHCSLDSKWLGPKIKKKWFLLPDWPINWSY